MILGNKSGTIGILIQCLATSEMLKLSRLIFLFVTFFMPKSVHQNPDLNIIIHLDESEEHADCLPNTGRGVYGKNDQFVGKCKEDLCMENEKCIKITYNKKCFFSVKLRLLL